MRVGEGERRGTAGFWEMRKKKKRRITEGKKEEPPLKTGEKQVPFLFDGGRGGEVSSRTEKEEKGRPCKGKREKRKAHLL